MYANASLTARNPLPARQATKADRQGSLGFKLRLVLAAYVHCLALGGDVLMAEVASVDPEVCVSSSAGGSGG